MQAAILHACVHCIRMCTLCTACICVIHAYVHCMCMCTLCRLYQTHLKDSHEKVRHKAAAAKQVASQPTKGGSGREANLRAAIMAPLSPNVGSFSNKAGKLHSPRQT